MDDQKIQDRIDIELSRTYFGKPVTRKEVVLSEKKATGSNRKSIKSFIIVLLILFTAAAAGSYFFLRHKKIIFTFNIKTDNQSGETAGGNTTSSQKLKKFLRIIPSVSAPQFKRDTLPPELIAENGKTLYDFEEGTDGWEIPSWAFEKTDHVARSLESTPAVSTSGNKSIGMYVEFQEGHWTGAIAEIQQYLDLSDYSLISADVYIPPEAPGWLRAKLILTVGENWKFTEMARSYRLAPGKWTTITASLADKSIDWWKAKVNKNFRSDIRKISIRIESTKYAYQGPVYIDNVSVYPTPETSQTEEDEAETAANDPPNKSINYVEEESWIIS